ncbi:hypothetical protein [Moritella viscosa]|uniref:Uncharacterized protein n=1 Tax=Moritella viscosa TaxID=80854 RepID=A0A1L0DY01_9GAMM|nr:hypothetical protein [Moritella viscosa]SGY94957.1 unnamed protein product [Moritella viscosa]
MKSDRYYRQLFSDLPPFLQPVYEDLAKTNLTNEELHQVLKSVYLAVDEAREPKECFA